MRNRFSSRRGISVRSNRGVAGGCIGLEAVGGCIGLEVAGEFGPPVGYVEASSIAQNVSYSVEMISCHSRVPLLCRIDCAMFRI